MLEYSVVPRDKEQVASFIARFLLAPSWLSTHGRSHWVFIKLRKLVKRQADNINKGNEIIVGSNDEDSEGETDGELPDETRVTIGDKESVTKETTNKRNKTPTNEGSIRDMENTNKEANNEEGMDNIIVGAGSTTMEENTADAVTEDDEPGITVPIIDQPTKEPVIEPPPSRDALERTCKSNAPKLQPLACFAPESRTQHRRVDHDVKSAIDDNMIGTITIEDPVTIGTKLLIVVEKLSLSLEVKEEIKEAIKKELTEFISPMPLLPKPRLSFDGAQDKLRTDLELQIKTDLESQYRKNYEEKELARDKELENLRREKRKLEEEVQRLRLLKEPKRKKKKV